MKNSVVFLFLLFSCGLFANVTLPNIFSDAMVLQRNSVISIWGWANPNEEITIIPGWNSSEYKTKTDNHANWLLQLPTPEAGGPFTITIKGHNQLLLKNILIGEVWICSGQSNMEMSASWGIVNAEEEIQKAKDSNIRFFTVQKASATTPQNNTLGSWTECSPETMKNFSAAGYFFAARLREELKNIPVGLILSAWGGTPAEIWMPQEVIQNDVTLSESAAKIQPDQWGPNEPGRAFNVMIYPLAKFRIAGVIWYQGESNVGATNYDQTFSALIQSWRKLWNYEFPFYYAQIAPYNYGNDHYSGVEIRNAQRIVAEKLNTVEMIVTSDISTIDDLHPKDKKNVGIRLANLALAKIYKTNSNLVNGPVFKNIQIQKNKILVHFNYSEGLHFTNKNETQFEIAGADTIFHPAKAVIRNGKVELNSNKVTSPEKVRFAWKNNAQSSLFNMENLPASSFTTE